MLDKKTQMQLAKQKDDGRLALVGMKEVCATWFNIKEPIINSVCVSEIVNYYLENDFHYDFFDWIRGGITPSSPIVYKRDYLEESFSDLLKLSNDLQIIADLFFHLYGVKFFADYGTDCIYCLESKFYNRRELNYDGIMVEVERLSNLREKKILDWEDIDESVELLNKYGYDINQDDSYSSDDLYETASNIEERLNQIFNINDID